MKPLRASALLAPVLLAITAPLAAQLVPLGPEFRINSAYLQALEAPAVALDGSGRLLAVWPSPGDGRNELLVRLFERDGGPAGPETALLTVGTWKDYPVAVALPSSGFALAWENILPPIHVLPRPGLGQPNTQSLRLLDAAGAAVGEEVQIEANQTDLPVGVRLAPLPSGEIVATWAEGRRLMARRFGVDGRPVTAEIPLAFRYDVTPGQFVNDSVGAMEDGSFLAVWYSDLMTPAPPSHLAGRYDMEGQPLGSFSIQGDKVAIGRDGRVAVARSVLFPGVPPDRIDVFLDLYDSLGRPLGLPVPVAVGQGTQVVQAAAMDEAGRILVVWSNESPFEDPYVDADLSARLFSRAGVPLGPAFAVATGILGDQLGVKVVERDGEWVIAWVNEPAGATGGGNHYARRFATCVTDGPSLCLKDRFRAEVAWRVPASGAAGSGQGHPLTGDTGAFWFFGPENLELVVKVLDGRAVNGNFWVFYGALSNVEYDLTVTDVVTGERRVYHNPAGTMASRADTRAFPAGEGAPAVAGALAATEAPRQRTARLTPPPCFDGPENLCLGSPWLQFDVRVAWRVPGTGETGSGKAVRLTGETGYFWFFGPENVELIVKILDGQAVNSKYWVFYGALSDVEYTITVTDRLTGKVKTYRNPAGTMASRADTSAF